MVAVTFDTLKFVRRLEKAGVPPAQAEAISAAVSDSHDAAELATKSDLREMELRIGTRFAEMGTEFAALKGEFTALKGEMLLLKWMFGFLVAGVATILVRLFL